MRVKLTKTPKPLPKERGFLNQGTMNIKTQIARLLRKEQTEAEAKLWKYLRNRNVEGLKFRRQHPIKNYIVDFVNLKNQIIIELDRAYHDDILQQEKDQLRDVHLHALGYKVLRFKNQVVFKNPEFIVNSIKNSMKKHDDQALTLKKRDYTVLSTKILTPSQRELLLNAGIGFVHYDAISIENLEVAVDSDKVKNVIFTSKNAVKAVQDTKIVIDQCFCVGSTTKKLLEENGQKVVENAPNAAELAEIIAKKYKNEDFLFFCGNLRRAELPDILRQHQVSLKEQVVYKTVQNSKLFNSSFDGILFFSPSSVQSYMLENSFNDTIAFCIGNTTAGEARKHTNTIIIANKPTVENVIVQAVKHFK